MAKDYYEILGVPKNASSDQIKEAYRKLVLKYHPDVNRDSKSEMKMQELNEAYAVLSNPEKRQQYDMFGPQQFSQRYTEEDIFRGFNFEDILKDLQGNFFGFSDFGGQAGNPFSDVEQSGINLFLQFNDIERGFEKEFSVQRYKQCPRCRGSGGEPGSKVMTCPECNGRGQIHRRQRSFFGMFESITTCGRCGGRGKTYEKRCSQCNGSGRIAVTERFRVRVDKR